MAKPKPVMTRKAVTDLEGAELDYAVAMALGGYTAEILVDEKGAFCIRESIPRSEYDGRMRGPFEPSTHVIDGDRVIDEFRVSTFPYVAGVGWLACVEPIVAVDTKVIAFLNHGVYSRGPTRLIAAMRAFVTHKVGARIDIPEHRVLQCD